jgi:hypothetical protein
MRGVTTEDRRQASGTAQVAPVPTPLAEDLRGLETCFSDGGSESERSPLIGNGRRRGGPEEDLPFVLLATCQLLS